MSELDRKVLLGAREVTKGEHLHLSEKLFSFCTLVNCWSYYERMILSFREGGFTEAFCEYLYINNTEINRMDSYSGYNTMMNASRGKYVIFCHQDICIVKDGFLNLVQNIENLEKLDPDWAVCGNAGGTGDRKLAIRISDPNGEDQCTSNFPARVFSLDENFIILRRASNISFSRDLCGFHFYGTDICIIADMLGLKCYVINFHIRHLGRGERKRDFYHMQKVFVSKYTRALRARVIRTPSARLLISRNHLLNVLINTRSFGKVWSLIELIRFRLVSGVRKPR